MTTVAALEKRALSIARNGRCSGFNRQRQPCGFPKGYGTDHPGSGECMHHDETGDARGVALRKPSERAQIQFATPVSTSPEEAIALALDEAVANVGYLGARIRELMAAADRSELQSAIEEGVVLPVGAVASMSGDSFFLTPTAAERGREAAEGLHLGSSDRWRESGQGYDPATSALFGPVIELDKEGVEHIVGEDLRGVVKLYNEWVDRMSNIAERAIRLGLADRLVRLEERRLDLVANVMLRVLEGLDLEPSMITRARIALAEEFAGLRSVAVDAQVRELTSGS